MCLHARRAWSRRVQTQRQLWCVCEVVHGLESAWEGHGRHRRSEEGAIASGRREEGEVLRVGVCWTGMKGG